MEGDTAGIVMDEFQSNSAWEVITTSWVEKVEAQEASIVFKIQMQRKPLYNLLTLVFPIIMLGILNLFVFVLPCESGEKAGYAVTVFLAFAVFLTIMESSFPQNSDKIAYFAIYVVLETVQSTLITLIALVMVRVSAFPDSTAIPKWLLVLVKGIKCKCLRGKFGQGKNKVAASDDEKSVLAIAGVEGSKGRKLELAEVEGNDNREEEKYTWKYVVNTLDIALFAFFFLAFVFCTLLCLLLAKSSD